MANETSTIFENLSASVSNDGKIILHDDNGATRSTSALSEIILQYEKTYNPGYLISIDNNKINFSSYNCSATGNYSVAVGYNCNATGMYSVAEGMYSVASGMASHAEGQYTKTRGLGSHAEGIASSALTSNAHAEGNMTFCSGNASHAEGIETSAFKQCCHAEGKYTLASSPNAHAEGLKTTAMGDSSHTEGYGTIAGSLAMHAGGSYNATSADALFVIGNGYWDAQHESAYRSDAFIIYPNGQASATDFVSNGVSLSALAGYKLITNAEYETLTAAAALVAEYSARWVVTPAS